MYVRYQNLVLFGPQRRELHGIRLLWADLQYTLQELFQVTVKRLCLKTFTVKGDASDIGGDVHSSEKRMAQQLVEGVSPVVLSGRISRRIFDTKHAPWALLAVY